MNGEVFGPTALDCVFKMEVYAALCLLYSHVTLEMIQNIVGLLTHHGAVEALRVKIWILVWREKEEEVEEEDFFPITFLKSNFTCLSFIYNVKKNCIERK